MGKYTRRSHRLAERADALDFYQQLDEVERPSRGARRRRARRDDGPFGEERRMRNRRKARRSEPRTDRLGEAG